MWFIPTDEVKPNINNTDYVTQVPTYERQIAT